MSSTQSTYRRSIEKGLADMEADKVIAAYKRWAPIYDQTFGRITHAGRLAAVEVINSLPVGAVLEVGVGTGIALSHYRGHRVSGIDLSDEMLHVARARVTRDRLKHVDAVLNMDAGDMTFVDGEFDIVTAMFVMTVVPDPQAVMLELARVCRPGGRIVVLNHFSKDKDYKSPLARTERLFAPIGDRLGWRPVFPLSTLVDADKLAANGSLRLISNEPVRPGGLFTLLTFQRV